MRHDNLLREAKRVLYLQLLFTDNDDMTDNEMELDYLLAKDKQMQEILSKAFASKQL